MENKNYGYKLTELKRNMELALENTEKVLESQSSLITFISENDKEGKFEEINKCFVENLDNLKNQIKAKTIQYNSLVKLLEITKIGSKEYDPNDKSVEAIYLFMEAIGLISPDELLNKDKKEA